MLFGLLPVSLFSDVVAAKELLSKQPESVEVRMGDAMLARLCWDCIVRYIICGEVDSALSARKTA